MIYIDEIRYSHEGADMANTFHLSLDVPDLDKAIRFYRELFGTDPAKLMPGYAKFELTNPDVALALQQSARPALSHLGIRVETSEEVEASSARLSAEGLITFDERDTTCCYARQDKVWVSDPAGNKWEIYTVLEDVEAEEHAGGPLSSSPEGACCTPGGACC
jgi:catechol 2,3-dioxygenase-like lactoylglutathione lyase family enzyme